MYRFLASSIDSLTQDVVCLCWDASSLSAALFSQPPRCVTSFWNLGCFIPTLETIQAQEDVRTHARAHVLEALEAANAAYDLSSE